MAEKPERHDEEARRRAGERDVPERVPHEEERDPAPGATTGPGGGPAPGEDREPSPEAPPPDVPEAAAAGDADEEVIDRTPEPMPDRRVYFPRGWGCALLVLFVVLIWLLVGVLWNPEWWPFWHEVRWGVGT